MPPPNPDDPRWAQLATLVANLEADHRGLAEDMADYHSHFWMTWGALPEDMSVAARTRECQKVTHPLSSAIILRRGLMNAIVVKMDLLRDQLGLTSRVSLPEATYPPDRGLVLE